MQKYSPDRGCRSGEVTADALKNGRKICDRAYLQAVAAAAQYGYTIRHKSRPGLGELEFRHESGASLTLYDGFVAHLGIFKKNGCGSELFMYPDGVGDLIMGPPHKVVIRSRHIGIIRLILARLSSAAPDRCLMSDVVDALLPAKLTDAAHEYGFERFVECRTAWYSLELIHPNGSSITIGADAGEAVYGDICRKESLWRAPRRQPLVFSRSDDASADPVWQIHGLHLDELIEAMRRLAG
jgi:hypothetical protein